MKTAAELWADTIKKQPIDDLTIKHTCESIEELINKENDGRPPRWPPLAGRGYYSPSAQGNSRPPQGGGGRA